MTTADLAALRQHARDLHAAGRIQEAIRAQIEIVNVGVRAGQREAADYHRLGLMLFAAQDFPAAATAFEEGRKLDPAFPAIDLNLGLCLLRSGRIRDGVELLERVPWSNTDSLDLLDGLADGYGKLGDLERARTYGERSLHEKDRRANPPPADFALPTTPPPPFRIDRPQENVIAFSLFGDRERYTRGAVKNAIVAPYLYPGWRCRFYVDDSVPEEVKKQLQACGAELQPMPRPNRPTDALFWRFHVAEDARVSRFLVRDCDSIVNIRERRAVDEWLASARHFHVLRDHAAHTDLILAGMWGGVANVLPPLAKLTAGFAYNPHTESRTADQQFLGRFVWPLIKSSCLIHDRVYRCFDARPFPPDAELAPGRHVGENDAAFSGR